MIWFIIPFSLDEMQPRIKAAFTLIWNDFTTFVFPWHCMLQTAGSLMQSLKEPAERMFTQSEA